ncbi:hypothetical protein [Pseudomonas tohonis]|uniref:hypothetical protein n=1 Tax=Pseudomonas tohonis TaxID=2725477 RepID=UPI001F3550DD|nr:hypothetical protein [Pseudomonas tohonis]
MTCAIDYGLSAAVSNILLKMVADDVFQQAPFPVGALDRTWLGRLRHTSPCPCFGALQPVEGGAFLIDLHPFPHDPDLSQTGRSPIRALSFPERRHDIRIRPQTALYQLYENA